LLKIQFFLNRSENVSSTDYLALSKIGRGELPLLGRVQARDVDASRNETIFAHLSDVVQRALDAVKDCVHNSRAKFNRKSLVLSNNRVPNSQSTLLLK
jgi:hypothetical protein